jgi:hypothetical protein
MVRLAEKNPQCLTMTTDTLIVHDTIQGDTIEFYTSIKFDTTNLVDSLRLVFQDGDSDPTEVIRIITKSIKVKPFIERNEHYYVMAYLEGNQLKVFVETYPKIIEKKVPYNRYVVADKPKVKWWMWLMIGGFIVGLINGIKK